MRFSSWKGRRSAGQVTGVLLLILTIPTLLTARVCHGYVWQRFPDTVNSNCLTVEFEVDGEQPESMAVVVERNDPMTAWRQQSERESERWRAELKTNRNARPPRPRPLPEYDPFAHADWIPFRTNLVLDLGPDDGKRSIFFKYRYKGQNRSDGWSGSSITVITSKPDLRIVSPTNSIVSQPSIQLQGYTSRRLDSMQYDVFDQDGNSVITDEMGHPGGSYPGGFPFRTGEDYFTCFDIELKPGTNTIVLRCRDDAGNTLTTNLAYVFTTAGDTTAPLLRPDWPKPGMELAGESFTARGRSDDPTARMEGVVIGGGRTNAFLGMVERNGYFWFEDIPLARGANRLTLTATDVAGNQSSTNLTIYGTDGPLITMDPVEPAKLWEGYLTLTGAVTPAQCRVWINGTEAVVKPDGTWLAEHVAVKRPNGGTAVFEMIATPAVEMEHANVQPASLLAAQASLGTNAMVLNPTMPACGNFQLRLTGTEGRPFVLLASTNLAHWIPILTNLNPDATFDFTDVNTRQFGCRFFRVIPLK